MPKRYYIGLAISPHDPAIAIIDSSGKVLFAEGAERRYQVKRATGCAPDNIAWAEELMKKYCNPGAEYVFAKSWSKRHVREAMRLHLSGIFRFDLNTTIRNILLRYTKTLPIQFNSVVFFLENYLAVAVKAGAGIETVLRNQLSISKIKTLTYDHHVTHASLACYGSPFAEGICLVADGGGEGGAISIYRYKDAKIHLLEKQKGHESLGTFYAGLTMLCGFDPFKGEEWKAMGLAAYGSFNMYLHSLFKSMLFVDDCKVKFAGKRNDSSAIYREIQEFCSTNANDLSLKANIAYNGQLVYSEWMNALIANIHKKYPSDNLIFTGGCALNSSYNGEILCNTPFKHLYIPSAPADDGCALGGALLAYYADNPHSNSIHKNISPYLGTEITDEQVQYFLRFGGQKIQKLKENKYKTVARLLADGKIIGWVQGKAEFGPRALGNRSILADPRKKEIKDIINERVKFREEFRPFAPSILHEFGHEYFEYYQESQYMERTLTFKKEAIDRVSGVVHVNNTGRLQTVKEEWNTELYHLIKAFHSITGVPVLLNTSFNVMGKPIVHTIEDALSTFYTTGVDVLVFNDYLLEK